MSYAPTAQQATVIEWVRTGKRDGRPAKRHGMVQARAGTGKTSLLMMSFPEMEGSVAATAYNKDIATEIETKCKQAGLIHVDAGTAHRFGLRTWKKVARRCHVDLENRDWFKMIVDEVGISREFRSFVRQGLNFARQRGIGIVCPANDPQAWLKLAADYNLEDALFADPSSVPPAMREKMLQAALRATHKALAKSVEIGPKIIDGEGMLYLPLRENVRYDTYHWVVMDEAQDASPLRRIQAKRMLRPDGRFLGVGDEKQAINAWAGADNDSMDILSRDFNCEIFPLTVTWRCPKAIVARAQSIVPDYEAAPQAPEGEVRGMEYHAFTNPAFLKGLNPERDALICRNTRPLVEMAFTLVKAGVPCVIEGKNLSKGLIALAKRWGDETPTVNDLRIKLDEYVMRETQRLMSLDREEAADKLNDEAEALYAFMEDVAATAPVSVLVEKIERLFADTPKGARPRGVRLMTAHKSKGLEFDTVYLLGANIFMPSKRARSKEAQEQEQHLIYVAWTRAKRVLVDVHYPQPGKKEKKPQQRGGFDFAAEGEVQAWESEQV